MVWHDINRWTVRKGKDYRPLSLDSSSSYTVVSMARFPEAAGLAGGLVL